MDTVLEEGLEPVAKPRARKTRYRVTVAPAPADADPVTELPRSLTEPTPDARPMVDREFVAYADSVEEAEQRVRDEFPSLVGVPLRVEEAGYVEDGRVYTPPEEEAAVRASAQDGRKAPGA
jgi:hypothetical protein